MASLFLFAGIGAVFLFGYVLGWGAGKARGKVEAIEEVHDIDLSGDGGGD